MYSFESPQKEGLGDDVTESPLLVWQDLSLTQEAYEVPASRAPGSLAWCVAR